MSLLERVGLASSAEVPERREQLRAEQKAFERGHRLPVEVAHARLDAAAESWQGQLRSLVAGGIPEHISHPNAWQVGVLLSLLDGVDRLHATLDELAAEGELDSISVAELEARRAEFAQERRVLDLAAEESEVARLEEEARRARERWDRRAEEVLSE